MDILKKDSQSASENHLNSTEWKNIPLGNFRSNGAVKEKDGFKLYLRRRRLSDVLMTAFRKQSSLTDPANPHEQWGSEAEGVFALKGILEKEESEDTKRSRKRSTFPYLTISVDSLTPDNGVSRAGGSRPTTTTWCFSAVDNSDLVEIVVIGSGEKKIPFNDALSFVLDNLTSTTSIDKRSIRHYRYCIGWDMNEKPIVRITDDRKEAMNKAVFCYRSGSDSGFTHKRISKSDMGSDCEDDDLSGGYSYFECFEDIKSADRIQINLVCHGALEDMCSFNHKENKLFRTMIEVNDGVFSINSVNLEPVSYREINNKHVYPVSVRVYDTICYSPAGHDELEDLAAAVNYKISKVPKQYTANPLGLSENELSTYLASAASRSTVPLLYVSRLFGYNKCLPVTLISVSAERFKQGIMKSLCCTTEEEYDRIYRGLHKVEKGKKRIGNTFIKRSGIEPINCDAPTVQQFTREAYRGGYNMCSEVGYFRNIMNDFDLKGAYPSAMCIVPDINWEDPIEEEVKDRDLTLADFEADSRTPVSPFVGYIHFDFPDNCEYPSIPIVVEDSLIYPLSSKGEYVYAAGPAIYLALKLGATVHCRRGLFLKGLEKDGKPSYSLRTAVKPLVAERAKAKKQFGKGSINELVFKELACGGYGKISQAIKEKKKWSPLHGKMEDVNLSAISNPVAAMMITSIVQAVLMAALNQTSEIGFINSSATTDGFISSCPMEILSDLDLYGLRKYLVEARMFLTDGKDGEIWEVKHVMDDLVNFTTRGNVSLYDGTRNPFTFECKEYEGVCAHNFIKSGHKSDSYKDRLWLTKAVLSRTGKVKYPEIETPGLKKVTKDHQYNPVKKIKYKSMDYDMKRKPIINSFHTDEVVVGNKTYKIAHFRTKPFRDIAEYKEYAQRKAKCKVLRTMSDWALFFPDRVEEMNGAENDNDSWRECL